MDVDDEELILGLLDDGAHLGIPSIVKKCRRRGVPEATSRGIVQTFIEKGVLLLDRDMKVYIP